MRLPKCATVLLEAELLDDTEAVSSRFTLFPLFNPRPLGPLPPNHPDGRLDDLRASQSPQGQHGGVRSHRDSQPRPAEAPHERLHDQSSVLPADFLFLSLLVHVVGFWSYLVSNRTVFSLIVSLLKGDPINRAQEGEIETFQ